MTAVEALSRKLCSSCGAQAVWHAEKQALVCSSCGTLSDVTAAEEPVLEYPLLEALKRFSENKRGWATEKKSVRCQHCNAISVFDPEKVAKNCDFCGSAQLIPQEEIQTQCRPESILPFKVGSTQVRDLLKSWCEKVWFAPNNFSKSSMADIVHGVYIPYWTFDAQVTASWKAQAGYHHYRTETFTNAQGKTQTRQVRQTRWENVSGSMSHFFNDQLVSASLGVHPKLLKRIEPFPTSELVPYEPSYVMGWTVEQYQVDLENAAKTSSVEMKEALKKMIIKQIPGNTYQNLGIYPRFSAQTFKHVLAPVWLVTYQYGQRTFQVLVNGTTASIAGEYPKSWVKIALTVLGIIAAVGGLVALLDHFMIRVS